MTDPEPASDVAFVLVDPEHPWNVGAVARAMANLGYADLRIAGERRREWAQSEEARRMAHGALGVLEGARLFGTFEEAVADRRYVVGTSARRREVRRLRWLDSGFGSAIAAEQDSAVVFGNERSGLAGEHLALCHEVVSIPTFGEQTSYNLAQAVLLVGFAIRTHESPAPARPKRVRPVERQIGQTLERLADALDLIGFWKPELEDRTRDHLRRIVLRGVESTQELGTLERLAHRLRLLMSGKLPPDASP